MSEAEATPEGGAPLAVSTGRRTLIGCFMVWIGFLSFGMVGALVSRLMAFVTRAQTCPDVPSCNWHVYVGVGGLIGAISLPWLVVRAMSKPKRATQT